MSQAGKDPLLFNKIAAGILCAGLLLWGINRVVHGLWPGAEVKPPMLQAASTPPAAPAAPAMAPAGPPSLIGQLASADVSKGQSFASQQCGACHTFTPGGHNGLGPNLYGVLGGPMFAHAGFNYSAAAKAHAHGNWDYAAMAAWLAGPAHFVPGTYMGYAGIRNPQTEADVIAWLRTLSATPLALPSAEAASAQASAAGPDLPALFAKADPAKGQAVFAQQCAFCHSIAKGGPNGVGPDLYGVIKEGEFAHPGYDYSDAVKSHAGQPWTAQAMNAWLTSPAKFAPGTRMGYPGIKNDQVRVDMIAYLNQQADSPAKLP